MKLSDQLRKHLDNCGLTLYAISKATGIDQASLGKFRNGQRGLSWQAVDKLGEFLGLSITATKKSKSITQQGNERNG